MSLFCKGLLLISLIALCACSEKSTVEATPVASTSKVLTGGNNETRIISIQSPTQCSLIVKQGRRVSDTITPKSCQLTQSTDGFISSVMVIFDAPCKQYVFKNVIGTRYFLDEKTIASKNPACVIESFNSSYSWNIEEQNR